MKNEICPKCGSDMEYDHSDNNYDYYDCTNCSHAIAIKK